MIPSSVTHIADHAPITLHSPPLGQSSLRWKVPIKITWFSWCWCCSIISLCVMFCGCCLFFCPFLAIVLSALLQLKASDYPLGIFKLLLISSCEVETLLRSGDFIGDIKYSCQNQSKCFKMVTWLPVDPLVMSVEKSKRDQLWVTDDGITTGTCFIQNIYAPSSSLLKRRGHIFCKEEEGGGHIFFEWNKCRRGGGIYFLNETSACGHNPSP